MKNQKISLSKLIFVVFASLFLAAVGTAVQAANIEGTITDGLGVYTGGNIYIGAFPDPNSTTAVASTMITSLPGTYIIDGSVIPNGTPLYIKARWDADASGSRNGGDVVGGYTENPIFFDSTNGNSGINITLQAVLVSGTIDGGSSGYTAPETHPYIYIGAMNNWGFIEGTGISNLGTYVLTVPGTYLGQQVKIVAIWDKDGSSDSGPFNPVNPTPGDWWGGYGLNPITLQVGTNSTIDISLTSEFFTLAGTVTRGEGGALISNLEVNVRIGDACEGEQPVAWAQTDGSGNYTLTLPGGFTYFLFANPALMNPSQDLAPEWYTSDSGTIYCAEAEEIYLTENTYGKNFVLENGGTITGTVKDSVGDLLSGVTVEIWNDALSQGWQQKVTDASGNFTFSDLSEGPWEIRIQPDPDATNYVHFAREYWLNQSENRNIGTITLQPGALVTGYYEDLENSPLELEYYYGGKFEIGWGWSASVDGSFKFRLPMGTYTLSTDPEDTGYTVLPEEIQVTDLNATYNLAALTAYDDTTGDHISGTVTDSADHVGQFMVLSFLSSQQFSPEKFGGMGPLSVAQPALAGDGSYSLVIPPDQTVNVVLGLFTEDFKGLESMTVVSTPIVGLDLSLDPDGTITGQDFAYTDAGFTLDGYVKSSTAPLPPYRANVLLYKQPGDQFAGFAESDETGYYRFYNVPGGDYKIAVTHPLYPDEVGWSLQFILGDDMTVPDIFMGGSGFDELAVDLGASGIYHYTGGTWTRLSKSNPEELYAVGTTLYADLGGLGLYKYAGGTWTRVSSSDPEGMVAVGSDLYIDFGSSLGLYKYNGTVLTRVNKMSPEGMCAAGGLLYADFGLTGLYRYGAGTWAKVSGSNPEGMVAVGSDLYIDFGSALGLYKYSGTALTRVTKTSPEGMCAAGDVLYADFGLSGLYRYGAGTWTKVSGSNPEGMVAVGSDLYIDFGSALGLYKYNGTVLTRVSKSDAEGLCAVGSDLYADFSTTGLYKYSGGVWTRVSVSNVESMTGVNLQ